jgi:hypothetical protein
VCLLGGTNVHCTVVHVFFTKEYVGWPSMSVGRICLFICMSVFRVQFFSVDFLIYSCLQSVHVCQECIENDWLPSTSVYLCSR